MADDYYLRACDITIHLHFYPTEFLHQRKRTEAFVLYNRKNFLIPKQKTIDYLINFMDFDGKDVILKKGKTTYINCSKDLSSRSKKVYYHLSEVELNMIFIDVFEDLLPKKNIFLLHASAVAIKGNGVVFLGQSGAGKSTIVKLLADISKPLADDIIAVKKKDKALLLLQTPFGEKNKIEKTNKEYPLVSFYILSQGRVCHISNFSQDRIVEALLKQLVAKKQNISTRIKGIMKISREVNIFNLTFPKKKKPVQHLIINHLCTLNGS